MNTAAVASQFKEIVSIVKALNEGFPPSPVPTSFNDPKSKKLVHFNVEQDPHFSAYLSVYKDGSRWWICCNNYTAWRESDEVRDEIKKALQDEYGIVCSFCHLHPVGVKHHRDLARQKNSGVQFFYGKVTWAD